MGQRCVHYTERDNGTRVLYAPNQCYRDNEKLQWFMWQTTDRTRVTPFDVNFHCHELDGVSFSRNKNFQNTCKNLYYSQRS